MSLPSLSLLEARVLGTLMEKARTVPDSYPLTLNSLVLGCNQKSSREPLMHISEAQAQQALATLKQRTLVFAASGSRAARWEHNFQRAIGVPEQSAVLLGLLILRGPQTAGELRLNADRWYRFADISSVEAFLDELQDRSQEKGGPLVVRLPRPSGLREPRWAHLLCGPVDSARAGTADPEAPEAAAVEATERRLHRLEEEVTELRSLLQHLCDQLGVSPLRHPEKRDGADN